MPAGADLLACVDVLADGEQRSADLVTVAGVDVFGVSDVDIPAAAWDVGLPLRSQP